MEQCPLCKQDINCVADTRMVDFAYALQKRGCRLAPLRVRLLLALALRAPRPVSTEALKDLIWGTDPNGGPDDADNSLKVHCSNINKTLELSSLDWRIDCMPKLAHVLVGDVSEVMTEI